jgi:hypothetical protein
MHRKYCSRAGPAGLLQLCIVELGLKPIVVERGKTFAAEEEFKSKSRDHIVNEDSNYCFGEGGARPILMGNCTPDLKRGDVVEY